MLRTLLALAATVCLLACNKKDEEPVHAPDVLMAHVWYPYKVQIVTVDSVTTVTIDASGNAQVRETVTRSDTSYILGSCRQQSTYHFQQNGVVTVKDMCSTTPADFTATWTITQTNMLSFPFASTTTPAYPGYNPTSGQVTKIDNSEFVFTTLRTMNWFSNTAGPNGTTIRESHKQSTSEYMTYKSK